MAEITATDTFDDELLEEEIKESIEPLIEWLNTNIQNIVSALQGNLGDKNSSTRAIEVKCSSGIRKSVTIDGPVSHVELSRIDSPIDSGELINGFNWWPTSTGFDFIADFGTDKKDRNAYLRIHFNV